jgi:hypothetical protein
MSEYRYKLESYSGMNTRYHCPYCSHRDKKFSRYIDTQTGEYLSEHVGKCERINSCGMHYTPKQYFQENNIIVDKLNREQTNNKKKESFQLKQISIIPKEVFKGSLKRYKSNNFTNYLINLFGEEITKGLIRKYHIGTSKKWNGATVYWQIDISGRIRAGKIMLYDPATGKRVHEPFDHITWVHAVLKKEDFKLNQCLFGEHLLKLNSQPIAIVESEKTVIIASVYFPQFIWLATGGANGLTKEKCETLNKHGLHVVLFPDISIAKNSKETVLELWSRIAKKHLTSYAVSELLQNSATEEQKKEGLDLADYLINFTPEQFRQKINQSKSKTQNNYTEDSDILGQFIEKNPYLLNLVRNLELIQYSNTIPETSINNHQ